MSFSGGNLLALLEFGDDRLGLCLEISVLLQM